MNPRVKDLGLAVAYLSVVTVMYLCLREEDERSAPPPMPARLIERPPVPPTVAWTYRECREALTDDATYRLAVKCREAGLFPTTSATDVHCWRVGSYSGFLEWKVEPENILPELRSNTVVLHP